MIDLPKLLVQRALSEKCYPKQIGLGYAAVYNANIDQLENTQRPHAEEQRTLKS